MENLRNISRNDLSFEDLMTIYDHIGEEERHFNELEMEYRKLASQWLLVSLGAIGFILTKPEMLPVNVWILVIGICFAAICGIMVLWLLDLKVYHELLHAAYREGVALENEFSNLLPPIRNNMKKSLKGGDIISKVILYYFFSVLILAAVANIATWMYAVNNVLPCLAVNILSACIMAIIYVVMINKSQRKFEKKTTT